ncbi:MAG: hypothetical protein GXP10_10720, partial [Gammaproteobacteria bacterium]|nr:hypothetical protein [Gammaproteobacteria bacterium]
AADIIGETITEFNNANARLGVGDSTVVFAKTQTDLQAAVNKMRKPMEASYPQRVGNLISFRALFGTADANFAWNEWGVFNAASAGDMLSRKVEALGTKANTQSWQLDVDLTVNNP